MKLGTRRLRVAVAAAALLVLPATASSADVAAEVSSLTASATATGVQVAGKASFAGDAVTLGEDPAGDATQKGIGADITKASVELAPGGRALVFTFDIGDQPPAPVSAGVTINYNWGLVIDGSDTGLFLSAGRAGLDGINPTTDPFFNLSQNGPDGFTHVASLQGKMADGVVQWTVPLSALGAKPGSVIGSYGEVAPGSHAGIPGVITYYNNFGGDAITVDDYTVPGSVMLGIAPAGTPVDQIAATTPASLRSTGSFTGTLPVPASPGTYTVVAVGCATADVCSVATTDVTI